MKFSSLSLAMGIVLGFTLSASGQTTRPTLFDPARHMHVSEVHPGMKGYGLTVFSGTDIVKFDVEVVSVLKNFNPKTDVVLIRCPDAFLSHTGPIAGMSGSPIFLYPADDPDHKTTPRMVGAFAYGWEMSKDCLAGVQPVDYMLQLPTSAVTEPPSATEPAGSGARSTDIGETWSMLDLIGRSESGGDLLSATARPTRVNSSIGPARHSLTDLTSENPLLASVVADENGPVFRPVLRPLATPLMTSGISSAVLKSLMPTFEKAGMIPLEAGGSSADATQPVPALAPGSVFGVPLLVGDADMTAIGTTTDVIGNNIFAFGHPFNNEGRISLPMGSGRIDTVIPTLTQSFKMGSVSATLGTLSTDESVGVAGQIGAAPSMIPLTIHTIYDDGSQDLVYHFQAAIHPLLTPAIIAAAIEAAVTGARGLPEHHTISYDATLEFANGRSFHLSDRESDSGPDGVSMAVELPVTLASSNPYQRVMPKKLDMTVHVSNMSHRAEIVNVTVPRQTYRPGETIRALVTYLPFHGSESVLPIEMPLPPSIPDGTYGFSVNDATHHLVSEAAIEPFKFTARNISDVFDAVTEQLSVRHDALYLRLIRRGDGVAMGRVAMSQVPSSLREVMLGDGRSDTTSFMSSDVRVVPTDWEFLGNADFKITVDRQFKSTTQP